MYKIAMNDNVILDPSWMKHLAKEFESPYMKELQEFLDAELNQNKTIYPPLNQVYSAFELTPFEKIKVVVIGQDPYHGEGQAHGLSFSVGPEVKIPPSLKNIYKELESDLGIEAPNHGYLKYWAEQGVLLLNSVLTVEASNAGSHQKKGWEKFTDKVIEVLNLERENLVFLLWGSPAQKKAQKVDATKHKVLKSVHPSPLSAYRGFFGCKHFSQANTYLKECGIEQIDWKIPKL